MNVFDQMAQKYDTPERIELAQIIRKELQKYLGTTRSQKVLDYGCGTGLVGIPLMENVEEMLFVDPSAEMLQITQQKLAALKSKNGTTKVGTYETLDLAAEVCDVIFLSLVMLHVPETEDLLTRLYQALPIGGRLLIVDFDENPAISHERVHNGFDQQALAELAEKIGFRSVSIETFHHGKNLFMKQDASLFLFEGKKTTAH